MYEKSNAVNSGLFQMLQGLKLEDNTERHVLNKIKVKADGEARSNYKFMCLTIINELQRLCLWQYSAE